MVLLVRGTCGVFLHAVEPAIEPTTRRTRHAFFAGRHRRYHADCPRTMDDIAQFFVGRWFTQINLLSF